MIVHMTSTGLDRFAESYDLVRIRRYRRVWWLLWLGWRSETDDEFRERIADELYRGRPYTGVA